jgi:hypothetical protein
MGLWVFFAHQEKKMIIVEFQGGLGNQMFQYAFYKALKTKYPASTDIKADISNYDTNRYHHGFELQKIFNIDIDVATKWEILKTGKRVYWFRHRGLFKKSLNKGLYILSKLYKSNFLYIKEKLCVQFDTDYFNLNIDKNYYLSGYWINEDYCKDIKDDLFLDFQTPLSLDENPLVNDMVNNESVSIHLRRGDYIGTNLDILNIDYYKTAIEFIQNKIANPVYYIFSDNIEHAKEMFDFIPHKIFVTENKGDESYKDMLFMSKCKHNIISNSTFSIWGAYLNRNKQKIVVAPNVYISDHAYYPNGSGWAIIDCKSLKQG